MARRHFYLLPVSVLAWSCSSDSATSSSGGTPADDGNSDASSSGPDASTDGDYQVGFALRDVSPTEGELASGEVYMGAYGILTQRGAAIAVHDAIYARTLVIRDRDDDAIALTILDMPGMSNRVIREMVEKASASTGIEAEAIFIGSTHSHSAPDLQGLWGSVPPDYRQRIIDLTVESIVDAADATEPAELVVSRGTAPNRNRRGWDMTDEELTVLDAKTPSGDRIASLVQFAAHPVKLDAGNHMISRDFIGFTVDRLEDELGAPVLYFNGIIGDCSPDGGQSEPGCTLYQCDADPTLECAAGDCDYQEARSYGLVVANSAVAAMDADATPVTGGLTLAYDSWEQAVTNPGFIGLADQGYLDYDIIVDGDQRGVRTQGGYFRLGTEVQGVAFPGEALTRTGLRIKDEMKSNYRLFLGLTTDSLGYFVLGDEWMTGRNGDYEETVSVGEGAAERSIEVIGGLVAADNSTF